MVSTDVERRHTQAGAGSDLVLERAGHDHRVRRVRCVSTGALRLLLRLPYFAPLAGTPAAAASDRSGRWWVALVVGALLPAVTLLPFFQLGAVLLPASQLLPQAFTNEIVVWAILNAVLVAVLSLLPGSPRAQFNPGAGRAIFLAALTVAVGYVAVVLLYAFFTVDLRYWFIALKPMAARQFPIFVAYLIPFALFFLVTLRALHATLTVGSHSIRTSTSSTSRRLPRVSLCFSRSSMRCCSPVVASWAST